MFLLYSRLSYFLLYFCCMFFCCDDVKTTTTRGAPSVWDIYNIILYGQAHADMYYRLYSLVIYKEIERKLRKQGKERERERNTKAFSRQFFVFGPPIAADAFVVARHFPISRFAIFASVFPPHPLSSISRKI